MLRGNRERVLGALSISKWIELFRSYRFPTNMTFFCTMYYQFSEIKESNMPPIFQFIFHSFITMKVTVIIIGVNIITMKVKVRIIGVTIITMNIKVKDLLLVKKKCSRDIICFMCI